MLKLYISLLQMVWYDDPGYQGFGGEDETRIGIKSNNW